MNTDTLRSKFERYVMSTYSRFPVALVRGKGSWVWDVEGKKYLDFTSGIAVNSLGHSHPMIIKAVQEQSKKLIHSSNLFYNESQVELAEILVKNSFADKVFFCNTGTEANEGAIKLARRWGRANGGRYRIIAAHGSFHGRTMGSLSVTGQKVYHDGFKPLVPGMKFVGYGKVKSLRKALDDSRVCAVIVEPIQGENGVVIPPRDYLREVRELCTEKGVLLILDEVQVGLGRTGRLFAYEHTNVVPDVMTLAKSLGGGVPAGAVLATDEVAVHFTPGSHGSTMGGNPLAMHTASVFINTLIGDGLLDNAARMGDYFLDALSSIGAKYKGMVKDVRGMGLILGVELRSADMGPELFSSCLERGFLYIPTVEKVIRILPPLNVSTEEIDFALEALDCAFGELS
ncbi:MAG: acetylornithine transaminase [Candidatus Dadabacteria bacterium]|nr:acetylornithine transaminase [Candidatus Dadabacteria bacterium]